MVNTTATLVCGRSACESSMLLVCPGWSKPIVRILITVSPRMYREALALAVHRHRPDFDVRMAASENVYEEMGLFSPHVLVRSDDDDLDPLLLERVLCWVEVMYTDSMNAKIGVDGSIEEVSDIAMDDLLRVVDEAERLVLHG
jgi:hypothetical protein